MQAVKWVVAKLQGGKTASFCREMSGREVTGRNQHPSLPWNFITHGFLDPSALPDFLCWEISAQGVSKNVVGNCVLIFFYGFLHALDSHLQCYRLRCFSFAQLMVYGGYCEWEFAGHNSEIRGEKSHNSLAHKLCPVTPVTGLPGRVPRKERFTLLGFRRQHKNL